MGKFFLFFILGDEAAVRSRNRATSRSGLGPRPSSFSPTWPGGGRRGLNHASSGRVSRPAWSAERSGPSQLYAHFLLTLRHAGLTALHPAREECGTDAPRGPPLPPTRDRRDYGEIGSRRRYGRARAGLARKFRTGRSSVV